jgi:Tfp pilus assembly protein PilZ
MSLMVQFSIGEGLESDLASTGMTRDLSQNGIFVQTSRLPSVGDRLSLTLHLTSQDRVNVGGEVIRLVSQTEAREMTVRPGFGARVTDASGRYQKFVLSTGAV